MGGVPGAARKGVPGPNAYSLASAGGNLGGGAVQMGFRAGYPGVKTPSGLSPPLGLAVLYAPYAGG